MAPAALYALYDSKGSDDGSYDQLSNSDIKKIVAHLCDYPQDPTSESCKKYWKDLREDIKHLPSYLLSHKLHALLNSKGKDGRVGTGSLCSGHKGLNQELIHALWAHFRAEFEGGIGPFLYPLIMEAGLPAQAEWKVRQLEPVLEMWRTDFDVYDHVPTGREAIRPMEDINGERLARWRRQEDGCEACMLARIGSDSQVLFALLAGMIGKYSDRAIGTKANIKSKRVRFVRYWLRRCTSNGKELVDEAWELGKELRRLHKALKEHKKYQKGKDFYGQKEQINVVYQTDSQSLQADSPTSAYSQPYVRDSISEVNVDVSQPWSPLDDDYNRPQNPTPLGAGYRPASDHERGFGQSERSQTPVMLPSHIRVQVLTASGILNYQPALSSAHSQRATIANTDAKEWVTLTPSWSSFDTTSSEQEAHSYREHGPLVPPPLQTSPHSEHLPHMMSNPSSKSFYSGYRKQDRRHDFDVSPPSSPVASPLDSPCGYRSQSRQTKWSDFY